MDHADHVRLIRTGVEGAGRRWLELGAGEGAFTLALADVLGPDGEIVALDRDARALNHLADDMSRRFPATRLDTVVADYRDPLPPGPFDGVLAANSLHFVRDPGEIMTRARQVLRPGGRLVVVEYDADRGNPWVPHPFSSRRFSDLAEVAGFFNAREIGRVPSRFLGAIFGAAADVPDPADRSATLPLHGVDREE